MSYFHSIKTFVAERAGHVLFVFGYLWLLLSVYALHNSIVLADWRLLGHLGPATVKALVFAKIVLIGEHLRVGGWFEGKPLIWPILIKAALFAALLIGFDFLEVAIKEAVWPQAVRADDGMQLRTVREIMSFSFMTLVALVPFFAIMELTRLIGHDQMRALFFHSHAKEVQLKA
jgi:hypothetical protein